MTMNYKPGLTLTMTLTLVTFAKLIAPFFSDAHMGLCVCTKFDKIQSRNIKVKPGIGVYTNTRRQTGTYRADHYPPQPLR